MPGNGWGHDRARCTPGGDVIDGCSWGGPHALGSRRASGSVRAGQREHLCSLAFGQATPDAIGLVHPQRVVAAGRHGRTLETDGLGLCLAAGPGGPSFALGMKEERTGHTATGRVQLPVPEIRVRSGKAPGVRHVDPLFSSARRPCRRSVRQVREARWFVVPTVPGIGARSTGQPDRARPRRVRAGGSACVVLPLGRIRADRGAVDLQTLEPSSAADKTLITIFVDLETRRVIVVGPIRRTPAGNELCELRHEVTGVSERTRRRRNVTNALRSVRTMAESIVTDLNPPSVYGDRRTGTRFDGPFDVSARPIGVWVIPPNDRGQVPFTASAGGVS